VLFGKNYFEIFDVPQAYDVDQKGLLKRYLDLQRKFHPDRYIASSDAENRMNMQWVAEINLAFETLSDDLQRAIYLLKLTGHELEENPELGKKILLKQIELREDLEEIKLDSNYELALTKFKKETEKELESLKTDLKQAFSIGHSEAIKNLIYEQQFLTKLIREAELSNHSPMGID
tara:strand:- start:598 stop:1125 length:528 start_codon:yes stop_codon:yes gene_type:complete